MLSNRFERLFPEDSIVKARTTIDTDLSNVTKTMSDVISAFTHAIASLKSRRNNEAPINNLPEKVLVSIFDIAGNSGYDHQEYESILSQELDFIQDLTVGWNVTNRWFINTSKLQPKSLEELSIYYVPGPPEDDWSFMAMAVSDVRHIKDIFSVNAPTSDVFASTGSF